MNVFAEDTEIDLKSKIVIDCYSNSEVNDSAVYYQRFEQGNSITRFHPDKQTDRVELN